MKQNSFSLKIITSLTKNKSLVTVLAPKQHQLIIFMLDCEARFGK